MTKILYHGTTNRASREIDANGWLGSVATEENMDFTSGELSEDGVVFLTENINYAREYGSIIYAVYTKSAKFFRNCPVTDTPEYVISVEDINMNSDWEIVED